MSLNLSRRLIALLVAVMGLMLFAATPAEAQKKRAPQISAFEMEPAEKLTPGGELFFRVQGTAGARATVRVTGVSRTIILQEVDDGTYEGAYVLRQADRANARSFATALLRKNGLSVTSRMPITAAAMAAAPQAPAVPLAIQRFSATPVDRIEPGAELKFSLEGTPGMRASFAIENVVTGVPMRETRPGVYEGSYTIKRLDRITGGVPIVATLEGANGQAVKSNLGRRSMLTDARPPTIRNLHPRDGETVTSAGEVTVSGTFDDRGGLGVDPASVKIVVAGRDVTASSTVTKDFFTFRADLPPGNYAADVTARDGAGNQVRSAWTFAVAPGGVAAPASVLPLEFTSHQPNAVVQGGRVQVRGRTAPGATVDVEVVGLAAVAGLIGVSHKLLEQRVTADANGNFGFEFQPQVPVPGMRYEVNVKAVQGNLAKDSTLVLFAQR